MSAGPAALCYRMALCGASRRDLSGAAAYARAALELDAQHERAGRLLALCLYELGEPCERPYYPEQAEALSAQCAALERIRTLLGRNKWRKAAAEARGLAHQSVRLLNIQGCLYASAKRYARAASFFALALEKDAGNALARECLADAVKRRSWR